VVLSCLAAVLLYLSFTATSSDVTAVSGDQWRAENRAYEGFVALCIGDNTAIRQWDSGGTSLESNTDVGASSCPTGSGVVARKVAVVTHESNLLAICGLTLLVLTTVFQVVLIARARKNL
jgi:hypothetical protein